MDLNAENETYNESIRRLATKMATGTGKTLVMSLIIIWQSVNHSQSPRDRRFTNQFAIITPGITVRDRNQRDLIPNREPNIYTGWNLVPKPSAYRKAVENAKVSITNFHSLQLREISWGQASSRTKRIARMKVSTENGREMVKRALGNLEQRGPDHGAERRGAPLPQHPVPAHPCAGRGPKDCGPLVQRDPGDKRHRTSAFSHRPLRNSPLHHPSRNQDK